MVLELEYDENRCHACDETATVTAGEEKLTSCRGMPARKSSRVVVVYMLSLMSLISFLCCHSELVFGELVFGDPRRSVVIGG